MGLEFCNSEVGGLDSSFGDGGWEVQGLEVGEGATLAFEKGEEVLVFALEGEKSGEREGGGEEEVRRGRSGRVEKVESGKNPTSKMGRTAERHSYSSRRRVVWKVWDQRPWRALVLCL